MRLVLYAFLAGCGGFTHQMMGKQCNQTFYVYERDLSPEQRTQVHDAFSYWNTTIQQRLWIDGGPVADDVEPAEGYTVVQFAEPPGKSDGACGVTFFTYFPLSCISKAVIYITARCKLSGARLQSVLRHEIGHAMGIDHSDDPGQLMYPAMGHYPDPGVIYGEELDAVRGVYAP